MATTKINTITTTIVTTEDETPIGLELTVMEGQVFCTSLQIADHFAKEHKHVIRDIEAVAEQVEETGEACGDRFQKGTYTLTNNLGHKVEKPMYLMNRDGFTLLAMGYTGKKAMKFKLAYIDAFNRMETALKEGEASAPVETITATQLKALRDQMENVTRYMKHDKASLSQTLWRNLKADLGYDKIEAMPATQYQEAMDWINSYQNVAYRVWDITRGIERQFIGVLKGQRQKPEDQCRAMLKTLEAPLAQLEQAA